MSNFPTWDQWLSLRETNSRKRAVNAALAGTGPELPASAAACPNTNPAAMKVAAKKGKVCKLEGASPDYSFDKWLKSVEKLGDDVSDSVKKGEEEEKELDKKKPEGKADKKPESNFKQFKVSKDATKEPEKKEDKWEKESEKPKSSDDSSTESSKQSPKPASSSSGSR